MPLPIEGFQGDYRFLSNFYRSDRPVTLNGFPFATAEHAYQALKSKSSHDVNSILACATPGEAKRLGKTLNIRSDWEDVKDRAMEIVIWQKFLFNPILLEQLLDTGYSELVESNHWHDNYWGACTCSNCAGLPKLNKLGNILMQLRNQLIEKTKIDI